MKFNTKNQEIYQAEKFYVELQNKDNSKPTEDFEVVYIFNHGKIDLTNLF